MLGGHADMSRSVSIMAARNDTDVVTRLARLAMVVTLLSVASSACRSPEDRQFYSALDGIPVGTTEAELLRRLGPPHDTGKVFYLGQPEGFEKQYREAAASTSVRYAFWRRGIDVVCAVGLDSKDRVAYKACGGT